MTLLDLVKELRRPSMRVHTGIWLAPATVLGEEEDEAARAGIDAVDVRTPLLAAIPVGARYAGLSAVRIEELLDDITQSPSGSDCVLAYNFDLLIARLGYEERNGLWSFLLKIFAHRRRAIVLVIPASAAHLLPKEDELAIWRRENRVIG